MSARLRFALLASVLAALSVAVLAGPASAHGDEGTMTVVTAEQEGESSIRLVVGLLYANDQELAVDATVSVTGTGPGGATLPATPLPGLEGSKYGATIPVPAKGSWTLAITSTDPTAEATTTVEVAAPATTTTRLAEPTTTTTEPGSSGSAPAGSGSESGSTDEPDATPADDDGGSGQQLAIALAAASAAVVLAFLVVARRRNPPGDDAT